MINYSASPKRLIKLATALVGALLISAASSAFGQIPAAIEAPAGNHLVLMAPAKGSQIYVGAQSPTDPNQLVWVFMAPAATLYNHGGQPIATHFAGPRWQANDLSIVRAAKVAGVASPDPDSIPWLLLRAVEWVGDGRFSDITYVQRLNTLGGNAPATPPAYVGEIHNSPYEAVYAFYKADDRP